MYFSELFSKIKECSIGERDEKITFILPSYLPFVERFKARNFDFFCFFSFFQFLTTHSCGKGFLLALHSGITSRGAQGHMKSPGDQS